MTTITVPCAGTGPLVPCTVMVVLFESNLRGFDEPILLGGRCTSCRRILMERFQ